MDMIKILGNGYMAVDSATNQLVLLEKESTIPQRCYRFFNRSPRRKLTTAL